MTTGAAVQNGAAEQGVQLYPPMAGAGVQAGAAKQAALRKVLAMKKPRKMDGLIQVVD